MYSEIPWGKPGVDPVTLFKIVFVQYLYGIKSRHQTIREIEVNNAYRWFIGYDFLKRYRTFQLSERITAGDSKGQKILSGCFCTFWKKR